MSRTDKNRAITHLSDRQSCENPSRRQFFTIAAGFFAALPGTTDELAALLGNFEDHLAPARGETRSPAVRWRRRRTSQPPPEGGQLFLTFDDGPLPCTGKILDQLAEKGQKATFFVLGRNLSNPKLRQFAVRALQEGHDLGNHSFNHPDFSQVSISRAKQEIVSTYHIIQELVQEVEEVDPNLQNRFFRFPYGVPGSRANYLACQEVLAELDYKIAWWDLDTNDWRMELPWFPKRSASVMASFGRARPGDVVLLHDRVKTSECLPAMLKTLETHKLASLPLSSYGLATGSLVEKEESGQQVQIPSSIPEPSVDDLAEELLRSLVPHPGHASVAPDSAVTAPHMSVRWNLW